MLTPRTPVCYWNVCACLCGEGRGTCTLESVPSQLDLGENSKDDIYRDERIREKQVPSAWTASLPSCSFLSRFAAAGQFIINPFKAAKISSRIV